MMYIYITDDTSSKWPHKNFPFSSLNLSNSRIINWSNAANWSTRRYRFN